MSGDDREWINAKMPCAMAPRLWQRVQFDILELYSVHSRVRGKESAFEECVPSSLNRILE